MSLATQLRVQGRQVLRRQLEVEPIIRPTQGTLRFELVAGQPQQQLAIPDALGRNVQLALAGQGLLPQLTVSDGKFQCSLRPGCETADAGECCIEPRNGIVTKIGRVEILQRTGQLEWLRTWQGQRTLHSELASGGLNSHRAQLDRLIPMLGVEIETESLMAQVSHHLLQLRLRTQANVAGKLQGM